MGKKGDKYNKKLNKVRNFWELLGSKVTILDPEEHDKVFSKTSHLPHVIAFTLMHYLEKELGERCLNIQEVVWKVIQELPLSDPLMWKDVTVSNKEAVLGNN
ncbi:MAG: hypothetical protein Ct9H300mP20_09210 [Gammaproteobacteria bacterium]|nr:MAG: hypothetical protein Ct9H300mP20_09210 [Gammaproteobacteria bacterium]